MSRRRPSFNKKNRNLVAYGKKEKKRKNDVLKIPHDYPKHRLDCQDKVGDTLEFFIKVETTYLFIRGVVSYADDEMITLSIAGDWRTYLYDEMIPEDSIIQYSSL